MRHLIQSLFGRLTTDRAIAQMAQAAATQLDELRLQQVQLENELEWNKAKQATLQARAQRLGKLSEPPAKKKKVTSRKKPTVTKPTAVATARPKLQAAK